ncbi:MAG: DUF1573 domain-containing protein [Planctomycetota bacterium]
MSQLGRRLCWIGGFSVCFAFVTAALAYAVTYKPYGVPDSRRAEYEEKVAAIKERAQIVQGLSEEAQPVASFDRETHDFGKLNPHSTASHAFRLTNDGQDPLRVIIQQTSCKCTVGKLGQSILLPGESTDVTMTWNTGYKAESYEQTAVISTNDPLRRRVTLTVKGTVRADLVLPKKINLPSTDVGETAQTNVMVYSQLWDDFQIADVETDIEGFQWVAEPVELSDSRLADREPKSACELTFLMPMLHSGKVSGEATVRIEASTGETFTRKVKLSAETRSPIAFYHPDIDREGLDLGTVVSDKPRTYFLTVRVRGLEANRELDVLDIEPKVLKASLERTSETGVHRLKLEIPVGAPITTFNRSDKHGYVQVGDPRDESFQNWFPLYGAVVQLDD